MDCPMSRPVCTNTCAIYMDGKCAIVVIAENLKRRDEKARKAKR